MKVYEIITDIILRKLEVGVIPWQKPWNGQDSMPKNLVSRKEYQGINAFILGCQQYVFSLLAHLKTVQGPYRQHQKR